MPVAPGTIMTQEHTRPTFVPDKLDDLRGPICGSVTLPLMLDWTPANTYNVENRSSLCRLYETVLSEATSEDDIIMYVDKNTLFSLWDELRIPRRTRIAWENIYPELRR